MSTPLGTYSGLDAVFAVLFGACVFIGTVLWVKRKLGL